MSIHHHDFRDELDREMIEYRRHWWNGFWNGAMITLAVIVLGVQIGGCIVTYLRAHPS